MNPQPALTGLFKCALLAAEHNALPHSSYISVPTTMPQTAMGEFATLMLAVGVECHLATTKSTVVDVSEGTSRTVITYDHLFYLQSRKSVDHSSVDYSPRAVAIRSILQAVLKPKVQLPVQVVIEEYFSTQGKLALIGELETYGLTGRFNENQCLSISIAP